MESQNFQLLILWILLDFTQFLLYVHTILKILFSEERLNIIFIFSKEIHTSSHSVRIFKNNGDIKVIKINGSVLYTYCAICDLNSARQKSSTETFISSVSKTKLCVAKFQRTFLFILTPRIYIFDPGHNRETPRTSIVCKKNTGQYKTSSYI